MFLCPQVAKATLPSISVSLSARMPPEGMSAEEAAAAVAPVEGAGELFPAPQPWRYVSEEEADGCNVLELNVSGKPAVGFGGQEKEGGGEGLHVLELRMPGPIKPAVHMHGQAAALQR